MIREATINDLKTLSKIELNCFPISEAVSLQELENRLKVFPQHFYVLEVDYQIIGFINGFVTNQTDLSDDMYENASLHDEQGQWQMIFGLDVIEEYRHQGYAKQLMEYMIIESQKQNRKGIVLTCKKRLIPFYEQFGFINEGVSSSQHGQVQWFQMRLVF